jgi:abortive infection bacteriophage resistance protein
MIASVIKLKSRGYFFAPNKSKDMAVFTKPAIPPSEQLNCLKARGLIIQDEVQALAFLSHVSFFRLTPYMRPFQVKGSEHQFKEYVRFEQLIQLYSFDRHLRLLAIDAIERIEVSIRAHLSNELSGYGAHWYLNAGHFKNNYQHSRLIQTIRDKQKSAFEDYHDDCRQIEQIYTADPSYKNYLKDKRKKESYARHYALTYHQPELMPTWAMLEELSLGELSHFYKALAKDKDKKKVAQGFGLYPPILESWLHTLTVIRNICAHHSRLWNRELSIKPINPIKKDFCWPHYLNTEHRHTRLSIVLSILYHMMKIIHPQTTWGEQLFSLFETFPEIPIKDMGLPATWSQDDFWNRC